MRDPIRHHGFLRVAAACPELRLADCRYNVEKTLDLLRQAEDDGVDLIVFPELGLTGYTCHDLFHSRALLESVVESLETLLSANELSFGGIVVVGLPLEVDGRLFNCGAAIRGGKMLGIVPKSYLPNYKEFYDLRYFAPAAAATSATVHLCGQEVPFGTDLIFVTDRDRPFSFGIEICEDLWMPVPPSSLQAIAGATVLCNLSASNETIGKAAYRRQLVASQSGRAIAGYIYSSSGPGESTTDLVFGGHCLIAENGSILAESPRFRRDAHMTVVDLDLDRLTRDRITTNSFGEATNDPGLVRPFRKIRFHLGDRDRPTTLKRFVDPHPFVPSDPATLQERCEEIFLTQVSGLARRLSHVGTTRASIGVSGGLDSTLALLVACKTVDALGLPRSTIRALTMPGYGTTSRTLNNARILMSELGVTAETIDIRGMAFDQMKALNHAPFGIPLEGLDPESLTERLTSLADEHRHDLVFENVQARIRTSLLMNAGFVLGTGDLSELALGWCTYNADHMSMYNVNVSVPKTLVKFLVRWAAENEFEGEVRTTLLDVVATEISPELLPVSEGKQPQSTESTIGPYELHDFFIYHMLRFGASPEKIFFLARSTEFDGGYSPDEIRHWLQVFLRRFFTHQFKRSCLPDGPKVGSVSVSPRGDWRMPSDASARGWLDQLDRAE